MRPSALSNTSVTEALPSLAALSEPLNIKSSPRLPRRDFIDCSPITQRMASATFDLPEPFGPTIALMGTVNSSVVERAKDLNPEISRRANLIKRNTAPRARHSIQHIMASLPGETAKLAPCAARGVRNRHFGGSPSRCETSVHRN